MPAFSNILKCGQGMNEGRMDFTPDVCQWVSKSDDAKVAIPNASLKNAYWYDLGRSCQLRLIDAEGNSHRFEGFKLADYDSLSKIVSDSTKGAIKLNKRALASAGQSWGSLRITGKMRCLQSVACGGAEHIKTSSCGVRWGALHCPGLFDESSCTRELGVISTPLSRSFPSSPPLAMRRHIP